MKHILTAVLLFLFISALYGQTDTTLVLIRSLDSTIVTDVKYATENNFTKKILYPSAKIYLRNAAALQLVKVNDYLKKTHSKSLKIFDGYRPLSVQKFMWSILADERFVANPAKGSRHNRGAAVDLTLIDSKGDELDMGTPYDDFTDRAKPDYPDISKSVKTNRKILKETMEKFGFTQLETEWWHFDFTGWEKYSILDIPIK